MMLFKMTAQLAERLIRRVGVMEQVFVFLGNRAPLGHRVEVDSLLPVLAAVQNDGDLLRQLVCLRERQDLEHLVQRAEPAGKNHERLREICEPELAHEKIMELEVQTVGDEVVRALLELSL